MNYRRLGRTGMKVSVISLGAWTTYGDSVQDKRQVWGILERALAAGINFFDNADVYAFGKAEAMLGELLRSVPRRELVLSSKVFFPMSGSVNDRGLSRKHVMESIDRSLARMNTDYVDIYFAHRFDPETPIEETVEAFSDVVRSGRAHYWGTSEWSGAQIAEAHTYAKAHGLVAPVTEQLQYSLLNHKRVEETVLPVTASKGIGLVVFQALAQGMLTGKYDEGLPEGSRLARCEEYARHFATERNRERVKALKPVADELGVTRAQLAIAWVLRHESVSSVITGASRVEQLEDNLKAADVELGEEMLRCIDGIFGS